MISFVHYKHLAERFRFWKHFFQKSFSYPVWLKSRMCFSRRHKLPHW